MRRKIRLNETLKDVLILMAEGNPGGLRALMEILEHDPEFGFMQIMDLDDMNIRGEQIWVGYNDYCEGKIEKLIEALHDRSPEMVDAINKICGKRYMAVAHGASFNR